MKIASVLLDEEGNNLLGNFFDTINIRQDVIIVKNDNKFGLFNVNDFSLILKCIWDSVSYNSYGIIASKNNHYAFFFFFF